MLWHGPWFLWWFRNYLQQILNSLCHCRTATSWFSNRIRNLLFGLHLQRNNIIMIIKVPQESNLLQKGANSCSRISVMCWIMEDEKTTNTIPCRADEKSDRALTARTNRFMKLNKWHPLCSNTLNTDKHWGCRITTPLRPATAIQVLTHLPYKHNFHYSVRENRKVRNICPSPTHEIWNTLNW